MKSEQIVLKLYYSKLPFPLLFIRHYWIELETNSEVTRVEVFKKWSGKQQHFILKDYFGSQQGLPRLYNFKDATSSKSRNKAHLAKVFSIDIEKANRLEEYIENYEFGNMYSYFPGPNSNTFIQQLLKELSIDCQLHWQAVGKDFHSIRHSET